MARHRSLRSTVPATTARQLGSLIKSARDIMRKDKGLNSDLDRLPLLTWIMFLKFLDDLEIQREQEMKLAGKKFRPAIEPPYRWRDWATNPQGVTGDELLQFINNDECIRPDGEKVLDPASGTGGFLVEAFNYLESQVKTVADRRVLQERSLFGCEPKSLPYLLCQVNLLLHGLNAPQIDPGNALRFKLSEIGEKDRVDTILTNPPFGGEEEKGIQGNFPEDRQTAEPALLFLQLIMRKLHRQPTPAGRPARAAVVVPNGTLFGDGVCARIKEELLKDFNLHTVVRLPNGVFAP